MYEALIAHLREREKLDPSNNTYKEAADAIEELQRTQMSSAKWIPVTERLPEKHQWVLVASKLVKMRTDFISSDGHWYTTSGVTHWMQLPEPPEGEC